MTTDGSKNSVQVHPTAVVSMMLHARKHKNVSVHGFLLGTSSSNVVTVSDAVPVSHGAPTKALIETATGLLGAADGVNSSIVGWYTAPALLEDTRPGPVALRMVAALGADASKPEPALIVLQNEALTKCLQQQGTEQVDAVIQAFGKDFGQQWLESIPVKVQDTANATRAAKEGLESNVQVNDLMDHFEGPASSTPWYPNKELSSLVSKFCKD